MDSFSFYLSYYGLILGLSVAQVASGLLNAIGARQLLASADPAVVRAAQMARPDPPEHLGHGKCCYPFHSELAPFVCRSAGLKSTGLEGASHGCRRSS